MSVRVLLWMEALFALLTHWSPCSSAACLTVCAPLCALSACAPLFAQHTILEQVNTEVDEVWGCLSILMSVGLLK